MQFSLRQILAIVMLVALATNAWILNRSSKDHDKLRQELESSHPIYYDNRHSLTDVQRAVQFLTVQRNRYDKLFEELAPVYDDVADQIEVAPKAECLSVIERPCYSPHRAKKFSIHVPSDEPLQLVAEIDDLFGDNDQTIVLDLKPGKQLLEFEYRYKEEDLTIRLNEKAIVERLQLSGYVGSTGSFGPDYPNQIDLELDSTKMPVLVGELKVGSKFKISIRNNP